MNPDELYSSPALAKTEEAAATASGDQGEEARGWGRCGGKRR